MLKLSSAKRYKQDLKRYQSVIDNTDNEKLKSKMKSLVSKLKAQVQMIDNTHASYAGKIDPRKSRDALEDLSSIRYELEKLIKEATVSSQ
jgi:ferritin-like metal-binding protein YciE